MAQVHPEQRMWLPNLEEDSGRNRQWVMRLDHRHLMCGGRGCRSRHPGIVRLRLVVVWGNLYNRAIDIWVNPRNEAGVLFNLGLATRHQGDTQRAAQLFEECLALGADLHSYDQLVATLRTRLPPEIYEEAWAAGCALSLDLAIEEALSVAGTQQLLLPLDQPSERQAVSSRSLHSEETYRRSSLLAARSRCTARLGRTSESSRCDEARASQPVRANFVSQSPWELAWRVNLTLPQPQQWR
jgi:hypothetical protein